MYKVKFSKVNAPVKNLSGKQIAYGEPAKFQFEVGCRVIAVFVNPEEVGPNKRLFYAGIIAECIKVTNNYRYVFSTEAQLETRNCNFYRYLIFFDDGCTQYVPHEQVRLVVKRSLNKWDDCHPDIRDFIKNYLEMYPERPMVRLAVNQKVKTEWNSEMKINCTLAQEIKIFFQRVGGSLE